MISYERFHCVWVKTHAVWWCLTAWPSQTAQANRGGGGGGGRGSASSVSDKMSSVCYLLEVLTNAPENLCPSALQPPS